MRDCIRIAVVALILAAAGRMGVEDYRDSKACRIAGGDIMRQGVCYKLEVVNVPPR